jgi:hypothetical protein
MITAMDFKRSTKKKKYPSVVSSHIYIYIEREELQCHRSYVTEREQDTIRGTRTTHLLLSGQMP